MYYHFYILLDTVYTCHFVWNICMCVHDGYWSVVFFFFFFSIWFWYHGYAGLIVWLGKYSILFNLLEEFVYSWYCFFLKYLVELSKDTGCGVFFGGGSLTTNSISLTDVELFELSIFLEATFLICRICPFSHLSCWSF